MADVTMDLAVLALLVILLVIILLALLYCGLALRRVRAEMSRDRRARRLERALERFYFPLLELEKPDRFPYPPRFIGMYGESLTSTEFQVIRAYWDGVKKHRYLAAGAGVQRALEAFLQVSADYAHGDAKYEDVEERAVLLVRSARDDIQMLEGELQELTFSEEPDEEMDDSGEDWRYSEPSGYRYAPAPGPAPQYPQTAPHESMAVQQTTMPPAQAPLQTQQPDARFFQAQAPVQPVPVQGQQAPAPPPLEPRPHAPFPGPAPGARKVMVKKRG